jgi:hypothetical protein
MSRSKKSTNATRTDRYNTRMIGDFFQHLLWDWRIRHFEHSSKPGTFNKELAEQLAPYIKRYKTMGFSPSTVLRGGEGVTDADASALWEDLRPRLTAESAAAVDALESAAPVIQAALEHLAELRKHGSAEGAVHEIEVGVGYSAKEMQGDERPLILQYAEACEGIHRRKGAIMAMLNGRHPDDIDRLCVGIGGLIEDLSEAAKLARKVARQQ